MKYVSSMVVIILLFLATAALADSGERKARQNLFELEPIYTQTHEMYKGSRSTSPTITSRMLPWKKLTSLMAIRPRRNSLFLSAKRTAGRFGSNTLSIPTVTPSSGVTAIRSTSMATAVFSILQPWFCKESSAELTKVPSTHRSISAAVHVLHAWTPTAMIMILTTIMDMSPGSASTLTTPGQIGTSACSQASMSATISNRTT